MAKDEFANNANRLEPEDSPGYPHAKGDINTKPLMKRDGTTYLLLGRGIIEEKKALLYATKSTTLWDTRDGIAYFSTCNVGKTSHGGFQEFSAIIPFTQLNPVRVAEIHEIGHTLASRYEVDEELKYFSEPTAAPGS